MGIIDDVANAANLGKKIASGEQTVSDLLEEAFDGPKPVAIDTPAEPVPESAKVRATPATAPTMPAPSAPANDKAAAKPKTP